MSRIKNEKIILKNLTVILHGFQKLFFEYTPNFPRIFDTAYFQLSILYDDDVLKLNSTQETGESCTS